MALLPLTYRRPHYVPKEEVARSLASASDSDFGEKSDGSVKSGLSSTPVGIPDALAFDKIIAGGVCPPCTLRDFMNYLLYIEHSAENLQFFLWYRDYSERFHEAPAAEVDLAPEWTQDKEKDALAQIRKNAAHRAKKRFSGALSIFKGTDFEKKPEPHVEKRNLLFTSSNSSETERDGASLRSDTQAMSLDSRIRDAYASAGAEPPVTTIQPFREEINRVITTYLVEGAPRQLNLSDREYQAVFHALSYTTHPTAFRTLAQIIERMLRQQAHPNFVRWNIRNCNPTRVTFARGLGVGITLLATIGAIATTLSGAQRGWRALFAIPWVSGLSTLITATKGMCVVLHGLHRQHVRPWELFADDPLGSTEKLSGGNNSFESFGSRNSYEDEPWVARYDRRFVVRKIFDREIWIQEPALRRIQDTVFLQSVLFALLGTGALTAVFVAVPAGNLF
ncbi:hypothetical protein GGS20DRAFT_597030 [Poronia punctata]|nr:hypothetical protein GGS20DRAFT_597030 [Poronia punctata]